MPPQDGIAMTTEKAKSPEAKNMDWVCAECNEAECLVDPSAELLLYCDGACRRTFHLPCAGLSQVPCEDDDWICKDCTKSRHRCAFCEEYGKDNVDVFGCSKDHCGLFFHESCLALNNVPVKMMEQPVTRNVSPRSVEEGAISSTNCAVPSFICPAHHCWTCTQKDALEKEQKEDEAEKKRGKKKQTSIYQCRKDGRLHRCLYCPWAYHVNCLPPTSQVNELAILCPEHSMTKKLPDLDPSTSVQTEVGDKIEYHYQRLFGQTSIHRQLPSGLGVGRRGGIAFADQHVPFCVPADILAVVYSRPAGNNRNKKAKFGVPQKEREPRARKSRVVKKSLSRPQKLSGGRLGKKLRFSDPDLKIVVGKGQDKREFIYYSHIMASQSHFFDKLLASPMNESKFRKIKLPDLAPKDWDRMMKCLELKNSPNMTLKDAVELAPLYNKYEFREGLEFCEGLITNSFNKKSLTPDGVCQEDIEFLIKVFEAIDAGGLSSATTVESALNLITPFVKEPLEGCGRLLLSAVQLEHLVPLLRSAERSNHSTHGSFFSDWTEEDINNPMFPRLFVKQWELRNALVELKKAKGTLPVRWRQRW